MARRGLTAVFAADPVETGRPWGEGGFDSLSDAAWSRGGRPIGIDPAEAEIARQVASVAPARVELPSGIDRGQLVVARGEADRPFVISDRPEALADGNHLTWMRIGLVIGPASILWGLFGLLLSHLG